MGPGICDEGSPASWEELNVIVGLAEWGALCVCPSFAYQARGHGGQPSGCRQDKHAGNIETDGMVMKSGQQDTKWHNETWSVAEDPKKKLISAAKKNVKPVAGETINEQGAVFAKTIDSRAGSKRE